MHVVRFLKAMKNREGAGLIANAKFLMVFEGLVKAHPQAQIVDFGAGIGTVTLFTQEISAPNQILAVEKDPWCREQYRKNCAAITRASLYEHLKDSEVALGSIVVIDDMTDSEELSILLHSRPSSILIEGHRLSQRIALLRVALTLRVGLVYSSFRGFPHSLKGGALFKATHYSPLVRLGMLAALLRVRSQKSLKLHKLEWELSRLLVTPQIRVRTDENC